MSDGRSIAMSGYGRLGRLSLTGCGIGAVTIKILEINRAVFRSPKRAIFGFGFGGKIHGPPPPPPPSSARSYVSKGGA